MSQVVTKISIKGWDEQLVVSGLTLNQSYNDHHNFELYALIPEGFALTPEKLAAMLGEKASIRVQLRENAENACLFSGFVDQAVPIWTSESRALRVTGYSPTVFLDCGPRFRAFSDTSLNTVIEKITGAYGAKLPSFQKKGAGEKVEFAVQTQETDYRFMCRLADQYGKVFMYDGEKMYFGDLDAYDKDTTSLKWGKEIKSVELSANLAPLNFRISGYNLGKNDLLRYNCLNECNNSHSIVDIAISKSSVYPASNIFNPNIVSDGAELPKRAKRLLSKQAYDLVQLRGVSQYPALKIGDKFKIANTKEMIAKGAYIIIEIHHSVGSDQSYHNTFTAVPAGYPFPLRMQATRNPVCGPLMATVKENADPEKLGRVKVQFIGDEENAISPWLRVLVPYTGHSGMYFIPEAGDLVVVQSEDFNVEKNAFVMGAFYHGKADAGQWYDPANKKKGFATEKTSFRIDDRSGKLVIEAEEIELIARRTMTIDGGRHLTGQADMIDLNP